MSTKSICIYFQVHQPYRLGECSFFHTGETREFFKGPANCRNKDVFNKVADKCYIPATEMFLELLHKHKEFRLTYSLSGVFLEQCLEFPQKGTIILDLFHELAKTGQVEFLAETYYHSLAFLYSKLEFAEQIKLHSKTLQKLFAVTPTVFRNTELIYSNEIAEFIRQMGFQAMLAEGWDHHLKDANPHHLYFAKNIFLQEADYRIAKKHAVSKSIQDPLPLLLKSYKLSDDISFRFGNSAWEEHPLFVGKFMSWLEAIQGETINLFMDYETIGEHQWADTGIFDFFKALPKALYNHGIGSKTASETIASLQPKHEYDIHHFLSWADSERDLSAWLENEIQHSALEELATVEKRLHSLKTSRNPQIKKLLHDFRRLQTSDHLYYMCTKYWSDGDVHKYFSPYESPYEAYINFMNTMRLLKKHIDIHTKERV